MVRKQKKCPWTTIKIPENVASKLKVIAASQGLTMAEYVSRATSKQMAKDADKVSEMLKDGT